jgi:hypothetical protein
MKTVSLDLSKKLKEAGYPQEGYFVWTLLPNDLYSDKPTGYSYQCMPAVAVSQGGIASPTADEILEQLPEGTDFIKTAKVWRGFNEARKDYLFSCSVDDHKEFGTSLADAAAKMWLYLKEQGLLNI